MFLVVATIIVMMKEDLDREETIRLGIQYFSWYVMTIVINHYFPHWDILRENSVLYFVTSICMIEAVAFLIENYLIKR